MYISFMLLLVYGLAVFFSEAFNPFNWGFGVKIGCFFSVCLFTIIYGFYVAVNNNCKHDKV